MSGNPPRRHHYIPQFYLRRWTGSDGKLERYTKPHLGKLDNKRRPTKAVGWWQDLYIVPAGDDYLAHRLEWGFFKRLDDQAALVLDKLNMLPGSTLNSEEISVWSMFLMSILHRTPENLKAYKATARRIYDETLVDLQDRYGELRGPGDPPTYEEFLTSLTEQDRERAIMRHFTRAMTSENIGTFLNRLHWRVFFSPPSCHDYLISDDPLGRSNGLQNPGGHLAIPISPRRLAVGAYEEDFLEIFSRMDPHQLVKLMNTWTVEGARHFVAACDTRQERFISNRFGLKLRPGFLDLGL